MTDSHHQRCIDGGIEVGDTVRYTKDGDVGEVIEIKDDRISVDFGGRFPYAVFPENLEVLDGDEQ